MNRILLLCFLFFYSAAFSQGNKNPFNTSENETYTYSQKNENQFATADHETYDDAQNLTNGTGPPGGGDNSVPIDNYIPFLAVVAVVMIGYIGKTNHRNLIFSRITKKSGPQPSPALCDKSSPSRK